MKYLIDNKLKKGKENRKCVTGMQLQSFQTFQFMTDLEPNDSSISL